MDVGPIYFLLTITPVNGVLNNDTDADGDLLSAAIIMNPTNGNALLNTDGSFGYTSFMLLVTFTVVWSSLKLDIH